MPDPHDAWADLPNGRLTLDAEEAFEGEPCASLGRWLKKKLDLSLLRLARRTGGGGGCKSTIYFAETDAGPLVVRVPHRGTGWSARLLGCPDYHCIAGAYAVNRLFASGQPVPELLAIEQDCKILGAPFAVFRRVAGIHLADYSEQWNKWPYPEEQWGEFLRACHSLEPVKGAGLVDDEGIGGCASWSEFISRLLLARAAEHSDLLPADFSARWRRLLEDCAALLDERPIGLLQMESNGYCNLILDPATHDIKAVLDFEEVTAGDPLFEFVTMAWHLGRRGLADHGGRTCFNWRRFYRGYGSAVDWNHPLVPLYRTVILLEKLWREDRRPRLGRLLRIVRQTESRANL